MRAVELLQSGVIAEGGAALDAAWSSGAIRAQPHDQMFLATLTLWAEVATVCAKEEVAAGIYRMLLPYQHQFVFTGASVYGPVAGPLAALASVLGNPAVARRHRELGRRQCAAMGAGVFAERLDPPVIAPI